MWWWSTHLGCVVILLCTLTLPVCLIHSECILSRKCVSAVQTLGNLSLYTWFIITISWSKEMGERPGLKPNRHTDEWSHERLSDAFICQSDHTWTICQQPFCKCSCDNTHQMETHTSTSTLLASQNHKTHHVSYIIEPPGSNKTKEEMFFPPGGRKRCG